MRFWFEQYKGTMYRTRWISIVAAAIMLAAAIIAQYGIYVALSIAEVPFGDELAKAVIPDILALGLIALCFAIRLDLLVFCQPKHYILPLLSWMFSAASIVLYLWAFAIVQSPSEQTCSVDGQCFTIYDQSAGLNIAMTAGLCFLFLSFVRAVFTAAYAGSNNRLK